MKENKEQNNLIISLNDDFTYALFADNNEISIQDINSMKKGISIKLEEKSFSLISLLDKSNIIALVGSKDSNTFSNKDFMLYDLEEKKVLAKINFELNIIKIKLTKRYIFIITQNKFFVFNIKSLKIIHGEETHPNPLGLFDVNIKTTEEYIIAYPDKNKGVGYVQISKLLLNRFDNIISLKCHNSNINFLKFVPQHDMIITSSDKGSKVRIFHSLKVEETLQELDRKFGIVNEMIVNSKKMIVSCLINDKLIQTWTIKSAFDKMIEKGLLAKQEITEEENVHNESNLLSYIPLIKWKLGSTNMPFHSIDLKEVGYKIGYTQKNEIIVFYKNGTSEKFEIKVKK